MTIALSDIASGRLRYLRWEPGPITVRLESNVALLRYRSVLQVAVVGDVAPSQNYWHMDLYVRGTGGESWQIVCS